jgi:hypothetical protein
MTPLERLIALLVLVSASAVIYRRTWRLLREAERRDAEAHKREQAQLDALRQQREANPIPRGAMWKAAARKRDA